MLLAPTLVDLDPGILPLCYLLHRPMLPFLGPLEKHSSWATMAKFSAPVPYLHHLHPALASGDIRMGCRVLDMTAEEHGIEIVIADYVVPRCVIDDIQPGFYGGAKSCG